jgi:hypothetical protein
MTDTPRAIIREIDGQLVLDDPDALAVIRAIERENIRRFLATTEAMRDRVWHFASRIRDPHGDDGTRWLVIMLCVDDPNGAVLAEALMPGHDWGAIRARGEVPWARGLADRAALQSMLDAAYPDVGNELRAIAGVAVLAMDRGIIAAFAEKDIAQ